MSALQSFSATDVIERGSIKDADVAVLRSAFFEDATVSQQEADVLFELNRNCKVQDTAWATFFNEAIVDYVVRQAEPEGYVTLENANWLIDQASENGRVRSRSELEVLVNVLEESRWSPPSLIKFCIQQVRNAILDDDSPLRNASNDRRGTILESEVDLLRRMVYAFAGDSNIAVTRDEAEVLFEINDAIAGSDVNPAWTEFFVKAIANAVMASSGYSVPSREQALNAEAWVDTRGDLSPTAMIRSIVEAGLNGVMPAYKEQSSEELALSRLERQRIEIVTNETITNDEAQWIGERLSRDGTLTPTESALVAYLKDHTAKLHPLLTKALSNLEPSARFA